MAESKSVTAVRKGNSERCIEHLLLVKFRVYKLQVMQQLLQEEYEAHYEFAHHMLQEVDDNDYLTNLTFSD
jgi:hypothetical protein